MSEKKNEDKAKKRRPGHPNRRPASKRHQGNKAKIVKTQVYSIEEAIVLLQGMKSPKFDESFELAMKLGVDPRKSDQLVRGSVSLPKGIGKKVKILVFAEGEMAEKAKEAGADYAGSEEFVNKIQKEGWLDFDVAIAHPSMMRYVGKLGKILGPKGKMPSPKSGTVTPNVVQAVIEFKAGKVEYRTDSGGNVHVPVGKKSFPAENLQANIETFIEHIKSVRPVTAKGTYIQKVAISTSMGPGLAIELKK